jgi:16S rRNA methyltransferase RsmF-like protein
LANGRAASERRLEEVPWRALGGLAAALEPALAEALAGAAAERVVDRFLRAHRGLGADGRRAAKEAVYGVAVWRRRLAYHASFDSAPLRGATLRTNGGGGPFALSGAAERRSRSATPLPLVLLAALLRDLAGVADAEALLDLPAGTLPPPRPPPRDLATRFSLPDWLAATLVREVGPADAPALADALNLPGPICFRPNALRTSPAALAGRLAAEGVATHPGALLPSALVAHAPLVNVHGLAAWGEGLLEVQDEGSQLAGALLGDVAALDVLDLCAGAGGKALQLAAAGAGAAPSTPVTSTPGASTASPPAPRAPARPTSSASTAPRRRRGCGWTARSSMHPAPSWARCAAAPTCASGSTPPLSQRSRRSSSPSSPARRSTCVRAAGSCTSPARSAARRTRRWPSSSSATTLVSSGSPPRPREPPSRTSGSCERGRTEMGAMASSPPYGSGKPDRHGRRGGPRLGMTRLPKSVSFPESGWCRERDLDVA